MGMSVPELQCENGLDRFQAVATFKAEASRVVGINAISRMLRHLGLNPLGGILSRAIPEKHRYRLAAPVAAQHHHTLRFPIQAADVHAQQVGEAFHQVDRLDLGLSSAKSTFQLIAER